MTRRDMLQKTLSSTLAGALSPGQGTLQETTQAAGGRATWVDFMQQVASPLLQALAAGRLRETMPIEAKPERLESRRKTTYLEGFARLLSGIAPWLELESAAEGALRARYRDLVWRGLAQSLNAQGPDAFFWDADNQNVVDAGFLALAVLRAPRVLNQELKPALRQRLIAALTATRVLEVGYSNWLLFAACVEAALAQLGGPWDALRVDFALRQHMQWYLGDGVYSDGPEQHCDYYNSYVIHPFLLAVPDAVGDRRPAWKAMRAQVEERAARYAEVQERMIAADGTYPVLGRSIAYRCGAFHALADVALRRKLAQTLVPAQVRGALGAVIERTLTPKGTFDRAGWLQIGLAGHQPGLGEPYISTGSLYLCANAFLPLGLAPEDTFWSGAETPWTAQKAWGGVDMAADHALGGRDMGPPK